MLCNYGRKSYHLTQSRCSSRGRPLVLFCAAVQLHPDGGGRGGGANKYWDRMKEDFKHLNSAAVERSGSVGEVAEPSAPAPKG